MNEQIFISYSRRDKERVFAIQREVEAATGTKCWIDLNGIESDTQFEDIIISAINRTSIFLFMYTQNSAASEWTKMELNFAKQKGKRIVFINIDGSQLTDWFLFKYSGHDIIDWANPDQHKKVLRNLQDWTGASQSNMPSADDLYQKGKRCYDAENFSEAVTYYRMAAEKGHTMGRYGLGICYYNGEGVEQDQAEAVRWFRMAAEQGSAFAQYNMAVCYEHGNGVELDMTEAVKWYRLAAKQGDVDAQYRMGTCCFEGDGTPEDQTEAVKWFRKAAEQGHVSAQYNLAVCYLNGSGVFPDELECSRWMYKAAEQGFEPAKQAIDKLDL